MPTNFFDLPREIRDIIYHNVLISPTGYIKATLLAQNKKSTTFQRPQFALIITSSTYSTDLVALASPTPQIVSLSLPRTCRQIYEETKGLFWTQNTFSCSAPQTLISTLKAISQTPSRLITSITLSLSLTTTKSLPRALRLLASRARHGAFRHLSLTVSRKCLITIERCRMSSEAKQVLLYDDLLEMLREGGRDVGFEKEMRVETLLREWRVGGGLDHDTVRDLHLSWGGRMIVNEEKEWEDFVHLGRCVGVV